MEVTESVRSGHSDRSHTSQSNSHHHHRSCHQLRQHELQQFSPIGMQDLHCGPPSSSASSSRLRCKRSGCGGVHGRDSERGERSVKIRMPGRDSDLDSNRNTDERVEVQVIHQDENWGDNTTAITGNTSETGFSMTMDSMPKFNFGKQATPGVGFNLTRFLGVALAILLSLFGFLSPIAMVILPRFDLVDWNPVPDGVLGREEMAERVRRCAPECEGVLISFSFKLLILLLGTLAVFFRQPRSSLPRVYVYRAVVLFLVFLLTAAFWLFYGVRIMRDRMADYHGIVRYADSLVNGLLFVHYLALVLLELRQLQPRFVVRVTRSPDGEVRSYSLGVLSVQRAAVSILEHYYRDFPTYNPYLDLIGRRGVRQNLTGLKVYDVDGAGPGQAIEPGRPQVVFAAAARGRDGSHNDRFYHEQEYERRARKRRARLQVTAEEAFTHVKRLQDEKGPTISMNPLEAAQAVFPTMARALQKYLRITRQQPRYTVDRVLDHLATCISHDLSSRAFVAQYLDQGAVITGRPDGGAGGGWPADAWTLVCEQNVIRDMECGVEFQLRNGDVSLMCSVFELPRFDISEDVVDPKSNKFVLRLNSETSV